VSYPESAGQYLAYRIAVALFAVALIFIGKSNLVTIYFDHNLA
jgi:hypothetical protein